MRWSVFAYRQSAVCSHHFYIGLINIVHSGLILGTARHKRPKRRAKRHHLSKAKSSAHREHMLLGDTNIYMLSWQSILHFIRLYRSSQICCKCNYMLIFLSKIKKCTAISTTTIGEFIRVVLPWVAYLHPLILAADLFKLNLWLPFPFSK